MVMIRKGKIVSAPAKDMRVNWGFIAALPSAVA
jgi:hypothetical protein